jgi:hypothetical protein
VLIALVAAALHATASWADADLMVGVDEDGLKGSPDATAAVARDLGVSAFRVSLMWWPGQSHLEPETQSALDGAVSAAAGMRIVVAVYGPNGSPPLSVDDRDDYCSYVRTVLEQHPQINDVVIWNEPNLTYYWRPQFNPDGTSAAPAAYEALLAQCWDVLHAFRPGVNVIGPVVSYWGNDNPDAISNISHSPAKFIEKLGEAYRASGRTRPIIDTFGHHPHPRRADERPWKQHEGVYFSMGDWGKLMKALTEAFEGTAQPLPGQGPEIWWLEVGYQTTIEADKTHLYSGLENWPDPVPAWAGGEPEQPPPSPDSPAPDQATQLVDSVRLSYCQPYVGAFFNFLLWDEPSLYRWQSGVLWTDGTRKGSYEPFKAAIAEANERRVDCSRMKGGGPFIQQPVKGSVSAAPVRAPAGKEGVPGASLDSDWATPQHNTALPAGYFEQATPSTLTYSGRREGAFGFLTLKGRLSAGGRPVAGKTIHVVAGGMTYSATTNRRGVARVTGYPPVPSGDWSLRMSFPGDPEVRPASMEAQIRIQDSRAQVTSAGRIRLEQRSTGSFRVSYDGSKLRGKVRFRGSGLDLRARRVTALGVGKHGRSAWFTGFNRKGQRFWAHVQEGVRGRRDRVGLWVGNSERISSAKVRSGDVRISPLPARAAS